MDLSHKLALFLEDMDIRYDIIPDDIFVVSIEFEYEGAFYEVGFSSDESITVNGDVTTYKDFINSVF